MWDTLSVPGLTDQAGFKFHVNAQRFPLEELPHTDEELAKWLEDKWVTKGEWLETKKHEWENERGL